MRAPLRCATLRHISSPATPTDYRVRGRRRVKWLWHRTPAPDPAIEATMARRLAKHHWDGVERLALTQTRAAALERVGGREAASAPESDAAS